MNIAIQRTASALLAAALLAGGAQLTLAANAAQMRKNIDEMSQTALQDLFAQQSGAKKLFDKSAGYAVFRATKGGFLVTGAGGTGVAVDKHTRQHTYMHMGSGGIGLGAGAQNYRLILFFQTEPALRKFIDHGWDATTNAQAAAGKAGVNATSSFVNGVAVYQLTNKGLMAEAEVSGTHFWKADKLNKPAKSAAGS
jgi:lipid-binding SYLF domain-containing protein